MPNILINPNSGIIEFSSGIAGGSAFNSNFTGGAFATRLSHDNYGGLTLTNYSTGFVGSGLDRFSVDGSNGRLFSVTDSLSGSLLSVNDIAGLPIFEVFDDNRVVMGKFQNNDFILTGSSVGIGGLPNTGTTKLYVSGNLTVSGNIINSGIADIFPVSETKRRYPPEGIVTTTSLQVSSGYFQYFPFLIKKDAINPKICVEVTSINNATPIRYGIYSGNNGFEGARLFFSGSIDCQNTLGVYTGDINATLRKGPYIIATANTGVATLSTASFRVMSVNNTRSLFGDPTGNSTLFGAGLGTSSHYYETGADLLTIIGSGLPSASSVSPVPALIY